MGVVLGVGWDVPSDVWLDVWLDVPSGVAWVDGEPELELAVASPQ
jgi:hypothetical protein